MNTRELTTRIGGGLLGLIAALAIGVAAASSAQAQSTEYAQKFHDAQLIRYTEQPFPNGAPVVSSLEAKLKITNHSGNEIKFVTWAASFIDPTTGAVIGTREITSKSRIAPGKEKTLKKVLRLPHLVNLQAKHSRSWATLPTIKTALASVTYADGTTSRTP